MKNENQIISGSFVHDIKTIIEKARTQTVRSVEFHRVQMYWKMGERIFNEEQLGKERADYGTYLIRNLAKEIQPEFGSGFSYRQLNWCRQFYRIFPIVSALRTQLNWSQYKMLISIEDNNRREYYELEAVRNAWTGRELERQISSGLFERLLLSNNKESVMAVARSQRLPELPQEIVKDPMILEFLGLERKPQYYEKDLESALIEHLQQFMLELGNGFCFVARQKRFLIEDDEYFADLIFYNRLLRCFVVIDIKTKKITHKDLGQLQMYVNHYDRNEKRPDENPTIGILLCASKNNEMVKLSLPQDNRSIMASQYQLYLPSETQLLNELKKEIHNVEIRRQNDEQA
jgi:predicted nuclease of restriction endonuclease-like (RecB) superfamily